jgi:cytoskeletal protein CcmA (bactofilin family)
MTGDHTGTAFQIDDVTTAGTVLKVNDNALTTGAGILAAHTTSVIAAGGSLIRATSSSADTSTTTGTLLDLQSSGATAGTIATITNNTAAFTGISQAISMTGQTTGTGLKISGGGSTAAAGGKLLDLQMGAATAGNAINVLTTGSYAGTGLDVLTADSLTTGKMMSINSAATSGITTAGSNVGSMLDVTESGAMTLMTGSLASINASGANTSGATGNALNINIAGTGQIMKAVNITDATTGALANGAFRLNMTGAHTGNGFELDDVTATGIAQKISTTALTTGIALSVSSTSTALTTPGAGLGSLGTFDWSPGSATTATGDLFAINIGTNGSTTGNLFNITDTGSSLFSVSETQITSALPHQFTAAGDVSIAYDLAFTNQTASYIKSNAPLTIDTGESFENNNLTLTTYGSGNILLNAGATAGKVGIGAGITPLGLLTVDSTGTAAIGKAALTVIQDESQDIFTASSSATTRFTIASNGTTSVTINDNNGFFVCKSATSTGLLTLGKCNGTAAQTDITEAITAPGTEAGDIIELDPNSPDQSNLPLNKRMVYGRKSTNTPNLLGVITTWGLQFDTDRTPSANDRAMTTAGVMPIKVSTQNGPIRKGDRIAISSTAGVGAKAVNAGFTVATATEDYNGEGTGKILALLNMSWYDPAIVLNDKGELNLDEIRTAILKPKAGTEDIAIQVGSTESANGFGKLLIQNAEGQTVASVDEGGNATFSGTLAVNTIAPTADQSGFGKLLIEGDVSVDGTLKAKQVYTDGVVAGSASVSGELQANTLKVDHIISPDLMTREDIEALLANTLNTNTQVQSGGTATVSGNLNELALENLFVTGTAAFDTATIGRSLTVGNDLAISTSTTANSIDTLNAPLSIQSSASQPLLLMAGLVQIDTNGNVSITGDLNVAGKINSSALTVRETTAESITGFGKILAVQDISGNDVASISATGAAEFASVKTDVLAVTADVTATESATLTGNVFTNNATAGSAKVSADASEVVINNNKVKAGTLIFVTATSETNTPLFVKSKADGTFTIGTSTPVLQDTTFNWWIVEVQ